MTALLNLTPGRIFRKQEFRDIVLAYSPEKSEASINWMLHTLAEKGDILSVGYGRYIVPAAGSKDRIVYCYPHTDEFRRIETLAEDAFPYVEFQMWELMQMNDFVNHQIAKNVIFVETEKMLIDSFYEMLHEAYPYAMYEPDEKTFYRQRAPETDVVVQKLLTESPAPVFNHDCAIEKILVDLFSKKLPGVLIEKSEYKAIYEDIFHKYRIDEIRMFRYARRRNLEQTIRNFINNRTDIHLLTESVL